MTSSNLMQKSFALNFDESRIRQILSQLRLINEIDRMSHPQFCGQGTHFQCFEITSGQEKFALKLAKQGFLLERKNTLKAWHQAMESLRPHWHPFIPPMKMFFDQGCSAYVQPFGKSLTSIPAECKASTESLLEVLSKHYLALNGVIQLATWHKLTFIHDWSDLALVIK